MKYNIATANKIDCYKMSFWYTINGMSGTPRKEIVHFVEEYFVKRGTKVVKTADPKGSQYGKVANEIVVAHAVKVSAFTEALLYLTCSKEVFDKINWEENKVVVSRGSFLETFGYQNQLSAWHLEEARKIFSLFIKYIHSIYPYLSIVLTEKYETAARRAGKSFEYKGKKDKYLEDTKRFLHIKEHPIMQEFGIKITNINVNGRNPWEVFHKEIKPVLDH